MPRRDPQTGKFVSGGEYDDVEVVTFSGGVGVEAVDMTGATGFTGERFDFEGVELIDYDEVVDRNESLELLEASHRIVVYQNSTATADGTFAAGVGISSSPARTSVEATTTPNSGDDIEGAFVARSYKNDTIDLIGRPLEAVATGPFSDTATGVGGGGAVGTDEVIIGSLPEQIGQFHPRDELFLNGRVRGWNIDDAGVHVGFKGQHIYGVISD